MTTAMSTAIRVRIGNEERTIEEADESWINQQINRRRAAGELVCVTVRVELEGINVVLRTPSCPSTGGGGRPPTPRERDIFELWERRGLNDPAFTGGNLVAFLRQLTQLI
jgi:hypothetical protein